MHFPELGKEIEEIINEVSQLTSVHGWVSILEKGTLKVNFQVRAPKHTTRAVDPDPGGDVYRKLEDADLRICRKIIEDLLERYHFKCKKCYVSGNVAFYYMKPDWNYWYGKVEKNEKTN